MGDLTTSFPIINNRYQIFGTIATGGMAVVYNAQDLILERQVALKILKKELSQDQSFQNRFRSEAKASASLIHPNIVTTFDFGFDGDRIYIVMEYISGSDLKKIIEKDNNLDVNQALNYLSQASKGLGFAHQSGFVHCDVKPQNMLISSQGVLKITDFGIARALETISREEKYDVVWGSPYYFSPEQAAGKAPSLATDVYSLGVIAYELVTGVLPFNSDETAELARMHRVEMPIPPSEICDGITSQLNHVIMKSLSKDPLQRQKDANEFLRDIQSCRRDYAKAKSLLIPAKEIPGKQNGLAIKHPLEVQNQTTPHKAQVSTILMAFLALILVGGLIPFWLYVMLSINSINR